MVTFSQPEELSRGGGVVTLRLRWSSDLPTPAYTVWVDGQLLFDETVSIEQLDVTVPEGMARLVEVRDDGLVPGPAFTGVVQVGWNAAPATDSYRIEEWTGAAWEEVARVPDDGRGFYEYATAVLTDAVEHRFRVIAVGPNASEGVPCEWRFTMGRRPDVPEWAGEYDEGTLTLTIQ